MSVINHMLQQLDKRKAGGALSALQAAAQSGGMPLAPVPENQSRRLVMIVSLGAALIGAATFAPLPATPPAPAPSTIPSATATGSTPSAAPAAPVESAGAVTKPEPVAAQAKVAGPPATTTANQPSAAAVGVTGTPPAAAASSPSVNHPALPALAPPLPQISKQVLPSTPKERARLLFAQAQEAAQNGHSHLAGERALQALALDSQLSAARQLAVHLALETGRSTEAEALLSDGLDSATPAQSVVLLARLRAERGDDAAALHLLNSYGLHTADAEGLRAALLAQGGEHEQALPAYEAALRQQPGNATWWLGLGVSWEAQGQPRKARGAYERAQQLGLPSADLSGYAASRLRALP